MKIKRVVKCLLSLILIITLINVVPVKAKILGADTNVLNDFEANNYSNEVKQISELPVSRGKYIYLSMLTIDKYNYPSKYIPYGKTFSIKGNVVSGVTIKSVGVRVLDKNKKVCTGGFAKTNTNSFSLANLDAYVEFDNLEVGKYTYEVYATDSYYNKERIVLREEFEVKKGASSIKLSNYNAPPKVLNKGQAHSIYGTVSSTSNIMVVEVQIRDLVTDEVWAAKKSGIINAKTYSLAKLDNEVYFNKLEHSAYLYDIYVVDASGNTARFVNSAFIVD
ncbi:hypothetical protein ACQPU1_13025 [Clostridium paraputrificum]|uniref:hypothetical protein n=1 Tax=Clostridium TaxID=1485 RepID=UPI003D3465E2